MCSVIVINSNFKHRNDTRLVAQWMIWFTCVYIFASLYYIAIETIANVLLYVEMSHVCVWVVFAWIATRLCIYWKAIFRIDFCLSTIHLAIVFLATDLSANSFFDIWIASISLITRAIRSKYTSVSTRVSNAKTKRPNSIEQKCHACKWTICVAIHQRQLSNLWYAWNLFDAYGLMATCIYAQTIYLCGY